MSTTQSNVLVRDREEVDDTYEKRKSGILRWLFTGNTEHWVRVSTRHVADDIFIATQRPIRAIYFNGKEIFRPSDII